jgi:hypothetical protein
MATVHAQPDYQMQLKLPPPPGYPTTWTADVRTSEPYGTFESRRAELLAHIRRNPAPNNTKMAYYELARWAAGGEPYLGVFHAAMDFIDARKDCSDFVLHSLIRLLFQFSPESNNRKQKTENRKLKTEVFERAKETALHFKYWPSEPGIDSMCTWTENHHILFASAAYLVGQKYPDAVFTNSGRTGKEMMALNRPRILRWLDLRFHTGFSEWLSHVYYDEDLTALLSLVDFADPTDPGGAKIAGKAKMVIDLILLDMALNSFQGVFGSTHGRAYENTKKWAGNEGTADTMKLLFGMGEYSGFDNMSAINFALSTNYQMPPVIAAVAQDTGRPEMENRQRMGIKLSEVEKWGINPNNQQFFVNVPLSTADAPFEDGMVLLTLESYLHPRNIELTLAMFDAFNWWENNFFADFTPYRKLLSVLRKTGLVKPMARFFEWDLCRNTREEVDIITYRTPDYMLSCAQDYAPDDVRRPGGVRRGGDQQHIWQATLGGDAVCFTTHPARIDGVTPNYWAGSGQLPRAAQVKNVLFCIYNLHKKPALYVPTKLFYTHAWLPRDKFDEVIEKGGWIFARKGDGYLALHSQFPYYWKDKTTHRQVDVRVIVKHESADHAEDVGREIIVPGKRNTWICELGRREVDGEFAAFVARISAADLCFDGLDVEYDSPSLGKLTFGWESPLKQNGQLLQLHGYPRYENPYVRAAFAAQKIDVALGEEGLRLNWGTGERIIV